MKPFDPPVKVCAVSYLNTSPLVWGMLHGDQRGAFDLEFRIPSECAREVATGAADIGIIPSVELNLHDYGRVRGLGIASRGAVRSILLVSSKPFDEIQTLAADISSRTSVALAQIILGRRYGAAPRVTSLAPNLDDMLAAADAALIIGDPALHLDPETLDCHVLDLGAAWTEMTSLPMVFAIWAGRKAAITPEVEAVFRSSYEFGRAHLVDIIRVEATHRGIPPALAREYLTRHIVSELGPADYRGLELFLDYARQEQNRHCGLTRRSALRL
ncbi:MAG TPA: menaquinone biosynthesis protein [Bryobacteraceae bacterium]|nr:menaquinone biosynthesis protein [Bryobacteraceae bacterium]